MTRVCLTRGVATPMTIMSLFLLLLLLAVPAFCTRIKDSYTYHPQENDLVQYLNKFGVQKGANVYLYGNVTMTSGEVTSTALIAFVNSSVWNQLNTTNRYSCPDLIKLMDSNCDNKNVRSIPPYYSVGDQYFMYIEDLPFTEFWYTILVFCSEKEIDRVCNGTKTSGTISFDYEFYIVNEDPRIKGHDPFTYQFSYSENGCLITYIVFSILYILLVPTHLIFHLKYNIKCQTSLLIWLFNIALIFEAVNILCGLVHYAVYSHDGYGVPPLSYLKVLLNLIGDWFLILVLILIAGGWMVTIRTVKWKVASFPIIGIYIFFTITYYICSVVYPIKYPWCTHHSLQNWAGGLYLAGRSILLFYIWYQIYHIHRQEEKLQKLRLYRVLFVIFTAWFWYLPLIVLIVTLINPVISWVVLMYFMNIMNFLVNLMMVVLFCPLWSHEYFQFDHIMNSHSSSVLMTSIKFSKQYSKISEKSANALQEVH